MFTGIIESTAPLRSKTDHLFWFDVPFARELKLGQSIACSGVCLTVVKTDTKGFAVEVIEETLRRTYLGELEKGYLINIERAMLANGRFDGHVVQGHVDGIGRILDFTEKDDFSRILKVQIPLHLSKYVVEKGSITLDGISLSIISVVGDQIKVGIIPHTWKQTNLHTKEPDCKLHLEIDVIAKYVEKMFPQDVPSAPVLV